MHENLSKALDYVSDRHIAEAAGAKKKRPYWLGAIAAVLAVVLLIRIGTGPMTVQAKAVSLASESRQAERPDLNDYKDSDAWRTDWAAWEAQRDQRAADANDALTAMRSFMMESAFAYLAQAPEENRVFSPVNAAVALSALAETAGGESQQQILELLGAQDLDALRTWVGAVWEQVYQDDGHEISVLANSLWLDQDLEYNQDAMDYLAYYHYASVYQADLSSNQSGKALQEWLNNNTGGLLKQSSGNAAFPPDAVMSLVSTIYLQSKWGTPFSKGANTQSVFHAPGGDKTCTFMNRKEMQTNYYWGDSFGAIGLPLKNGCVMWFFLPDEGKSPEDVLAQGEYWNVLTRESQNFKYMKVNLSLPKFDVSSSGDLAQMLQKMGMTDVFDPETANFTALTAQAPVFLTGVNQAARVIVDEEGVKAASYIEIPGAGAAAPPEEIIDFILDRPFLFVIATEGIPLFVGAVNQP